jgi:hypothetical protein
MTTLVTYAIRTSNWFVFRFKDSLPLSMFVYKNLNELFPSPININRLMYLNNLFEVNNLERFKT